MKNTPPFPRLVTQSDRVLVIFEAKEAARTHAYVNFCVSYVNRYINVGHDVETTDTQLRQHLLSLYVRGAVFWDTTRKVWELKLANLKPEKKYKLYSFHDKPPKLF